MTPNPQDSAVALEVERAAFEAYIVGTLKIPAARDANGGYVLKEARTAWHVWLKARASQSDGTTGVPDGWKLVPAEPTDEMEAAAENDYEDTGATFPNWKSAYRAMLAAASRVPNQSQGENHVG